MLEFSVDPDSPYHKPDLDPTEHELVLYCQSGWRSAPATAALVDMGAEHVAHIDGGLPRLEGGRITGHPAPEARPSAVPDREFIQPRVVGTQDSA